MKAELDITALDTPRNYQVAGELDMSNAHELADVLREECRNPGDIVFDISGLRFMDSSGLHVVLDACEDLSSGKLIMRNPSRAVSRVFDVSGIERHEGIQVEKATG